MIVGTAGHIDHGKTTLVRALTGVDTDRLKEEKARGISIELGYAYTPLVGGAVLGFVDVPGHERLVHTMVAGACSIDLALLVVAADDGIMPQTREHLAILQLLGIAQGAVALTKTDLVGAARVAEARAEVAALLSSSALHAAPVFAVNATDAADPGTRALGQCLHETVLAARPRRSDGLFRLAVDRVFTLPGQGTIAAGMVFGGEIHPGDTLEVMPAGATARVRTLHAHNRAATGSRAGERCALNLTGIERRELARGDWLAAPDLLTPTLRLDVRLQLLPAGTRRLGAWSALHVHLGTMHRTARIVPLESAYLSPGENARAQLVFDNPLCALPGDRFIVRDAQAAHTLGGGTVLDPFAPARRRRVPQRRGYLDALEQLAAGAGADALIAAAPYGVGVGELPRLTGMPPCSLRLPADTLNLGTGRDAFVLTRARWTALRELALQALREFHAHFPDEPGVDAGRLRRMALPDMPPLRWRALIEALVREQLVRRGARWLQLPDHTVKVSAEDEALGWRLRQLLLAGRYDPPWLRTLAQQVHEPEPRVREVLRKQLLQGSVYEVVHDLFYDATCVGELAELIRLLAATHGEVSAAACRDALGLGRKRTIQILEFFDRVGHTRRVRDRRVVRSDSAWRPAA
jgi:selenocysteine-specific elongation factor